MADASSPPQLIVVPHAAPQYSGHAADCAFAAAARAAAAATGRGRIRHVVLLCTRHSGLPGLADAGAPTTEFDHSLAHQAPFLRRWFPEADTTAFLVGPLLAREQLAQAAALVEAACTARPGTLVVASGDFMHVGPRFEHPVPAAQASDVNSYTKAREDAVVRALSQATASARARGLAAADAAGRLATVCGAWVFRLLVRLRCFEGLAGQVTCYYTSAQAEPTAMAAASKASTASKASKASYRRRRRRGVSCPRPRTFRRLRRAESRAIADAQDGGCVTYVSLHYRPARPSRLREALTRYEGQALLRWAWAHVRGEWARRRGDARARPPAFRRPFRTPGMERDDLGVFVTFSDRRSGALRGCLGTVDNAERLPLADAVAHFAVQAGFHDPRPGLTRDRPLREGEGLRLEVTLLGARTPLRSVADWRIHRDGLYVERREAPHASAVFLPSVATEQGWDRRTTLAHLVAKAEGRGGEPDPEVLAGGDAAVRRRYALYAVPGRAFGHSFGPTAD